MLRLLVAGAGSVLADRRDAQAALRGRDRLHRGGPVLLAGWVN